MAERYYVVIVGIDGGTRAARICTRDYDAGKRVLAAASILADEPVDICVTAETACDGRPAFLIVPPDRRFKIREQAVASAIGRCVRQITGDETDRYLREQTKSTRPRPKSKIPVQLDLFGASA